MTGQWSRFSRLVPRLAAGVLLLGLGCGRITYETVWTVDGGPGDGAESAGDVAMPAVDAGAPDTAAAPEAGAPESDAAPGSTITLGGHGESARVGSTTAGTPYRDLCPPGEVVIGYQGTQARSPTMPWLQAVQTQCGSLLVGPGPGYAITTVTGTVLPLRGMSGGNTWRRPCPVNQVVVGFEGRSSPYVDQLAFRCAPLTITGAPGSRAISRGVITTTAPTDSSAGAPFAPIDCPAGQIAVGSSIAADNFPRSFGLFCATPSAPLP